MIGPILASASALVVGVLLGGCSGKDTTTEALLNRNAALQSQVSASQNVLTGLAITLVLMACGLAASLYRTGKQKETHGKGKPRRPAA